MRSMVAAVLTAALLLIGYFGAPLAPVVLGATLALVWWRWGGRRGPPTTPSLLLPRG